LQDAKNTNILNQSYDHMQEILDSRCGIPL